MEVDLLYGGLEDVVVASEEANETTSITITTTSTTTTNATTPIATPPFTASTTAALSMPFLHIYPLTNYTFAVKDCSSADWETSYHQRMSNLESHYRKFGMRRVVEAVMITYEHNHPHVLLLQLGDSNVYKLPGDYLKEGEEEFAVLQAKLDEKLSPPGVKTPWNVEPECLGTWYRPNFDNPVYPYVPAHVLHPKERISLFLVRLPSQVNFALPRNAKFTAVPLCDLYENGMRYGPIIAGLPHLLSRFNIVCL